MVWTSKQIDELKKLWLEGRPTAEIGRRIGVTKNATIGKIHRLHLPPRPSPIIQNGEPRPLKPRPLRDSPFSPSRARTPRPVTLPPLPTDADLVARLRAAFRDAPKPRLVPAPGAPRTSVSPARTCQYPYGERLPYRFCGAPVVARDDEIGRAHV